MVRGSGKTSFIHLIRKINEIEHTNQCRFIHFNPWYFTGTEKVLKKFHDTLLNAVGSFSLSLRSDLHKYFLLVCAMENTIWKTNFLKYFEKKEDFDTQLDKLKKHFEKLPQRIVIIIDDLDRLQKDEILVLFRTIRLIADFPNVVYLVGYSHAYIRNILNEDNGRSDKASFMGKIFQLEFELPEPLPSDLKEFWRSVLENHIPSDSTGLQNDIVNNIVDNHILSNLREIKRFLNQITLNSSLPEIKSNTYFPQFFLLELLFYYDYEVYNQIRKIKSCDINLIKKEIEKLEKAIDEGSENILSQIIKLSTNTDLSITKEEHLPKYFFKRLDTRSDIRYEDVEKYYIQGLKDREFRNLYFKNTRQFVGHSLELFRINEKNKEKIDKTIGKTILERTLKALEQSYLSEGIDKDYFGKISTYSAAALIKGCDTIWSTYSNGNESFLKEFKQVLLDNLKSKCFSHFLRMFHVKTGEISEITLGLNSIFKNKIEFDLAECGYDTTALLITLHNYQIFYKSAKNPILLEHCALTDPKIVKGLREKADFFISDIKKLENVENFNRESLNHYFVSKEILLNLNDGKNKGVFKLLDSKGYYYSIDEFNKPDINTKRFRFDRYNYRIQLDQSIESITISSGNNRIYFSIIKGTNGNLDVRSSYNKKAWTSLRCKAANTYPEVIDIFRTDKLFLYVYTNHSKFQDDIFFDQSINENPLAEFTIQVIRNNFNSSILKRRLIPENVLTNLERKKLHTKTLT